MSQKHGIRKRDLQRFLRSQQSDILLQAVPLNEDLDAEPTKPKPSSISASGTDGCSRLVVAESVPIAGAIRTWISAGANRRHPGLASGRYEPLGHLRPETRCPIRIPWPLRTHRHANARFANY